MISNSATAKAATITTDKPRTAARILVVEDLMVVRNITRRTLETAGYQVDVAKDGVKAVRAARKRKYDLILMDVQMPAMDGVMATREIRASDGPCHGVPVVAMTAKSSADHLRSILEAGMNGHLVKPLRQADLINAVERWVA